MSKSQMPKSKAKTAYGLLSEIAALITAEPKRYCQYVWRVRPGVDSHLHRPPCGTVGCIAGWVTTLKAPTAPHERIPAVAAKILGLSDWQQNDLFYGGAVDHEGQTRLHARSGAAFIRKFQKKYRAQLLAKRVR